MKKQKANNNKSRIDLKKYQQFPSPITLFWRGCNIFLIDYINLIFTGKIFCMYWCSPYNSNSAK